MKTTPLDYFLSVCVNSLVYPNKAAIIDDLKPTLNDALEQIYYKNSLKNWTNRLQFVKEARGGHILVIIFKH